ncbi:hypothetical protein [Natrialba swarupiae]|uniref:Uncharacterized protein n=1 Tax=Natrialba swarupiae TaxID=2448032 RepID=A0A5D5ANG9_9EURY|nr:hypothetical protein [Natrialba swarupiae]TYT63408.1 hypothetical protein FYC77_02215 [Natrialba swarupiae]
MSSFRTVLSRTTSSWRLVAVAALVAALEGGVRIALVDFLDPYFGDLWLAAAVVLWPPVFAVFGLAAVSSTARDVIAEEETRAEDDVASGWDGEIAGRLAALAALATVGHWIAIVVGTALFLVVDTPIRFVLYWVGYGDLFTFTVVTFGPFAGIGIGALVAWIVPGIAVAEIGRGVRVTDAFRTAMAAPSSAPRSLATATGWTLAFVGFSAGAFAVTDRVVRRFEDAQLTVGSVDAEIVPIALGLSVLVTGGAVWLAGALGLVLDRFSDSSLPSRPSSRNTASQSVPVARLAIVVLLVTALVATAGAVRMNEIRPIDTEPEPLSGDPDELYATAHDNTERSSHEYRWLNGSAEDEEVMYELRIDREERQLSTSFEGIEMYFESGMYYYGEPAPLPGYAMMTQDERLPKLGEPSPEAENWTVVAEDDDEITLELTDPDDVYSAEHGRSLEESFDDPEVHEAWARITVDTGRKTLSHGDLRMNVSERNDPEDAYDYHLAYEYETDVSIDRPDDIGSPGLGEWFWRLFAY